MNKCYHCHHQVVWQNDFSYEDYCREGDGIVQVWYCPNCGAEIEVHIPLEEEENNGNN